MWFFGSFGTVQQRERTENASGNASVVCCPGPLCPPAQYGRPCPAEAATESALLVIQRVAPAYELGRAAGL